MEVGPSWVGTALTTHRISYHVSYVVTIMYLVRMHRLSMRAITHGVTVPSVA